MALKTSSVALARRVARLWSVAVAGTAALLACSASSTPHPPEMGPCVETNGVPCRVSSPGGGASPPSDGGGNPTDSGAVPEGEGGTCPGTSEIFANAAASCAGCAAAKCCANATSCPNDPNCLSIAVCVTMQCLANDQSCLPNCEAAAPTGSITAYIDFQQCIGENCTGCTALSPTDI